MRRFRFLSRKSVIKLVVKHPFSSFILTVIGLFLTLFFGYLSMQARALNVSEIKVGHAPYQMNDRVALEDMNLASLRGVNDHLRRIGSEYRLNPSVVEDRYESVLNRLARKDIHVAFLSQGIYGLLINDKIEGHKHKMGHKYQTIGFMKRAGRAVYKAGVLYNRKLEEKVGKCTRKDGGKMWTSGDELIDSIRCDSLRKYTFLLNQDECSTSSHIFPEVFLLEKGINLKIDPPASLFWKHKNVRRTEMASMVRGDTFCIAFISNEDFERLPDKERKCLNFLELSSPIPYDAIVVNAQWWKGVSRKKRKQIMEALDVSPMGFVPANSLKEREQRREYHGYLFSGVVYGVKEEEMKFYVQLPDREFDIKNLYEHQDSVDVYAYYFENAPSNAHFTIRKDKLCRVKLEKETGKSSYYLHGDSVLLKHYKEGEKLHVILVGKKE